MKRLILITLILTLALSIGLVSSVTAADPVPVTIHKTIGEGCPVEDFTFQLWRDYNNNGILDCVPPWCDFLVGTVVIHGAGTGVINSNVMGASIVHEVLSAGSVYEQQPDQVVVVSCAVDVYFDNVCRPPEECELVILKTDADGNALDGACFNITPDPRTGTDSLALCDNTPPDECPEVGVLCLSGLICGLTCTVEETVAPDGYEPAEPQTVTIEDTPVLTFVNERCGLIIHKVDAAGNALAGACFNITPDPKTGTGVLTLCDNDLNDECSANGVLCLSGLICGLTCTVDETVAPDGYDPAPPQTVTISDTVTLTFVNTPKTETCGTVCAAQGPGCCQYLFGGGQANWFTYITYNKGWGNESSPKTYPIYTGITTLCGTLYVYDKAISGTVTHLFVNYVLMDTDTCELAGLSVYHLQVDRTLSNLKSAIVNKSGNPVPGKCEYIDYFDPMQPSTGWIECTNDNIRNWSNPIYIFAHGVGCYYCP